MTDKVILYNPVDEDDPEQVSTTYRAVDFTLPPNSRTSIEVPELPSFEKCNVHMIAGRILEIHADRGVVALVEDEASNEALIAGAEQTYDDWLINRHQVRLKEHQERLALAASVGAGPPQMNPYLERVYKVFKNRKSKRSVVGAVLALLLFALPARAQETVYLALDYDLDALTATAVSFDPRPPVTGPGRIETSGSSATVTSFGLTAAFGELSAGDAIFTTDSTTPSPTFRGIVLSVTSTSQIVLVDAVDLSASATSDGYAWRWLKFCSGTGADDCWVSVDNRNRFTVTVNVDSMTGDGNGIDWKWQCRNNAYVGTSISPVYPTDGTYNNVTAASTDTVVANIDHRECRLLMLWNTADDAADAGREKINAVLKLGERNQ